MGKLWAFESVVVFCPNFCDRQKSVNIPRETKKIAAILPLLASADSEALVVCDAECAIALVGFTNIRLNSAREEGLLSLSGDIKDLIASHVSCPTEAFVGRLSRPGLDDKATALGGVCAVRAKYKLAPKA